MKIKIAKCPIPHCGKPIDLSDWNGEDPIICMCCCEQFEYEEIDQSTIKEIEKTW